MLTIEMIKEAREVIKEAGAICTPIVSASKIAENVYVKCENLQKTGSFKIRGASYKIAKLSKTEKEAGIIACSAGNHAQGVALSATKMGYKSIICMPDSAPLSKVEATRGYGAEVVLVPGAYDDAFAVATELQKKHGYTFVHPYNDECVIAGQGTIALEILEQMPEVECIIVPMGGGGVSSGIAFAIKTLKPACTVIGVQAVGASAMVNSIREKKLQKTETCNTIADGCAVKAPGDKPFEVLLKNIDKVISVTEKEIAVAMLTLLERHKIVSEGAGAMSSAAVMSGKVDATKYKNIVCLVSGGNVDISVQTKILNRALVYSGRIAEIKTIVLDKPGHLARLLDLVSNSGANIIEIRHLREADIAPMGSCVVNLLVETKGEEHKNELYNILTDKGYSNHGKPNN